MNCGVANWADRLGALLRLASGVLGAGTLGAVGARFVIGCADIIEGTDIKASSAIHAPRQRTTEQLHSMPIPPAITFPRHSQSDAKSSEDAFGAAYPDGWHKASTNGAACHRF
jgi:hypothetical protein